MASRDTLPSDPHFLLDYMHDLPYESGSDDDFEGYLEPEDGPVAYRSADEYCEQDRLSSTRPCSRLLDDLSQEPVLELHSESPLSPFLCPMQGQLASGSPLATSSPTQSPMQSCAAAGSSSSTHSQVKNNNSCI